VVVDLRETSVTNDVQTKAARSGRVSVTTPHDHPTSAIPIPTHPRKDIEASWDSNTATYQQNLVAAISTYESCLQLADRLSLFSPNETLEDLTSGDLQYASDWLSMVGGGC
jgi:hypothetical protein